MLYKLCDGSVRCNLVASGGKGQFWKLHFGDLMLAIQHLVLLENTATHLAQLVRVDLVTIPHVRILLAPLFESAFTTEHWTSEWLLSRVDSQVVFQS